MPHYVGSLFMPHLCADFSCHTLDDDDTCLLISPVVQLHCDDPGKCGTSSPVEQRSGSFPSDSSSVGPPFQL